MIPKSRQLDIGDFYDFRSTYSDGGFDTEEDDQLSQTDGAARGGGVKLGAKRNAEANLEKGEDTEMADVEGEDGWETDSTFSDVPSEEIGAIYCDNDKLRIQSKLRRRNTESRRHRSADGFHSHAHAAPHAVYYDDFELHLPSGRVAGHRSMNRYFRQNLRNYPTPDERAQRLLTDGGEGSSDEAMPDHDASAERGRRPDRQLTSRGDGGPRHACRHGREEAAGQGCREAGAKAQREDAGQEAVEDGLQGQLPEALQGKD